MLNSNELEKLRSVGDPLADATIQELFENNQKGTLANLMSQLNQNEDIEKTTSSPIIKKYFDESANIPIEINYEKLKSASEFYGVFGPEISMFLLMKSLPETYSCKNGVQVLYRTGRLMKNRDGSMDQFTRRLMETSQFVVDVLDPNAFTNKGRAIVTAQKVRLMHAAIRYYIQNDSSGEFPKWDNDQYGLPINQEDLAGTLCSFSSLILEAFSDQGIEIDKKFEEGFMHAWEIIGHVMGLQPNLIPKTNEEGLKLGHAILKHQESPSKEGVALTESCLDFIHHLVPGNRFNRVINLFVTDLIGTEKASMLGIENPQNKLAELETKLLLFAIDSVNEFKSNHDKRKSLLTIFNRSLMKGMLGYFNENKQVMFRIPPDLRNNWEINSPWEEIFATPTLFKRRISYQKKIN
jgi:hypothetical protein